MAPSVSQFWQVKTLAQASLQVSQDYYPETWVTVHFLMLIILIIFRSMAKLAIINAPSSFAFIWSVIKPWLAKETAEKVDILGSDYQKVLLELIDAENLPTVLGGKCTCEHAGGCDLSGAGPWMDERLARQNVTEDEYEGDTVQVDFGTEPSPPLSSKEAADLPT